ncbi:SGNH/GDSL hydrolase family protein [Cytobacillus suaedae]|nr:SGNH/GDSL hydrolase family protein [Cytobacillus suaedae]
MTKNIVKFLLIVSLVFGFAFQSLPTFAESNEEVVYVSLGDSLAAGRTPFGENAKGYPDFIAEKFEEAGALNLFVRDYAVNGYTTQHVLDDLKNNVTKGDKGSIQEVLKQATHITIDIGANDLLANLDRTTGAIDQVGVINTLKLVGSNLAETVTIIKQLNPTAKVYLMGYFNALPHLPQEAQAPIVMGLHELNKVIEGVATLSGSTYVATEETVAANIEFLPNPKDIHLSEEGYKAVAELFWNVMKPEVKEEPLPVPAPVVEDKEVPVVYWDGLLLKKGQIGKVEVVKPINLWKRDGATLVFERVLQPGEHYRVYRSDDLYGGQYGLGNGYYVTKMEGYINYQTPSKAKLQLLNN